MTWLPEAHGPTALERALALHPKAHEAVRDFSALLWDGELVDPVLLELVRLRVAMLHGVQAELLLRYDVAVDAGLSEEKIQALPSWPTSPLFSDLERGVLRLAEQFVIDAHGVTDEDVAPVREALDSPGLVALMNAIAFVDHLDRIRTVLEIPAAGDDVLVVAAPSADAPLY